MHQICKMHTKEIFESRSDPNLTLLQIRMTPLGQGLPSPATILFTHPMRGIMTVVNRLPIDSNSDEEHHNALIDKVEMTK